MPLPPLILDNRSYQQLRDELIRRIPVYTQEWTDHNPSDPGITLIELFAYLGENLLYRFNQIPEATRLEFLRLLQIPLHPARPATALIALSPKQPVDVLVEKGSEARAGNIKFETETEVRVLPVTCVAVSKQRTDEPDAADDSEREISDMIDQVKLVLHQQNPSLETDHADYYQNQIVTLGELPVDFDRAVDNMIWIAVLANGDEDPVALRQKLIEHEKAPLWLNVGFIPDQMVPPVDTQIRPCPGVGANDSEPAVEWQISTGSFHNNQITQPRFHKLRVRGDTTDGLTRQGVVRLELPTDQNDAGNFDLGDDIELAGTGELPPQLDDESAAKTLFWLRAFRHDKSPFGKVIYVGANCTPVSQLTSAGLEFLGTGNGQPNQSFRLNHSPVLAGSLTLQVEATENRWESWTDVDGFHASFEGDRHFTLDRESGEVRFGNGLQGAVPQIGQRIRAVSYRYGGGSQGNVPANAISKLPKYQQVKAANPLRATGGSESESLDKALDRIPGELRRRDRAVTEGDFQELALMTPGANVGRAECLPRFDPRTRQTEAAGIVTVVVWPRDDPKHPRAPVPDRGTLRRVCRWLDERRLVTTELYVVPPRYRKINVSVGLAVKPGYGIEAVRLWVELVLRQYLAPLPPYGPEGEGWPLGRRVYGPELEAAALQVEGVEFLEGLIVTDGADGSVNLIELDLDEVPELNRITVVEGQPLPPGDGIDPDVPDSILPIPVIREEC